MKAGKESDSQIVRSGISGAYCRKVKMFDDGLRNTRGGRPLSVIPASRKGYSLALEVSGKQ